MGTYAHGINQKLWVAAEATFGTVPGAVGGADSFVAADGVRIIDAKLTATKERNYDEMKNGSRSVEAPIGTRRSGSWSIHGYFYGGSAATNPPDFYLLWKAAMGDSSASGSDYQFAPLDANTNSLSIMHSDVSSTGKVYGEYATGCVAESLEVKAAGDGHVEYTVSGPCKAVAFAGQTTLAASATASGTSLTLTDGGVVTPGAIVTIDTEVMYVSAVSANTATVTRGWGSSTAAAHSSAATMYPWYPSTQTLATTKRVPGTLGSLTLNGGTIKFKSWTVAIKNAIEMFNDHYATESADGFVMGGKREITFSGDIRLEKDSVFVMGDSESLTAVDAAIVWGNTAGNMGSIDMDYVYFDKPEIDAGTGETSTTSISGRAVASSSFNDEIMIKTY